MSLLKLKSEFCKLKPSQRLYGLDIPLIGLTGGIATGKSTASGYLAGKRLPVIDADALVKDIYAQEQTKSLVSQNAPEAISAGQIDFKRLRESFFSHPKLRQKLEEHIYSLLPAAFRIHLAELGKPQFVIYDVPLLFEKNLQEKMDLTLLIYAPKETQIKRLISRDEIDKPLAETIISNQMPIEEKKELGDFIIKNDKSLKQLKQELDIFCDQIFS